MCCRITCCTVMMVPSPPRELSCKLLYNTKYGDKKFSSFARRANQRLHVIEIPFQCLAARRGQAVFGLWQASVKRFRTNNVVGFLQAPRVHAQVAVGGL